MRKQVYRWLLPLSLATSVCLMAQPEFFRRDIPVGAGAGSVAAGDFNGDGLPDLAVGIQPVDFSVWEFTVLINEGGGEFGPPIRNSERESGIGWVADFDGDGKDDFLSDVGYLYLSRGDGTFLAPLPVGDLPWLLPIGVGDFNNDSRPDVVLSHQVGPQGVVSIWHGNGDGTFQTGTELALQWKQDWAATTDFNQDGQLDLILFGGSPVGQGFFVFLGHGDGTFDPEILTLPWRFEMLEPPWAPGGALIADFNGDQFPDIAASGGISLGNGDGTFEEPAPVPGLAVVDPYHRAIAAADFTGDGRAELVVEYLHRSDLISFFPGTTAGNLSEPVHERVGLGNTRRPYLNPADLDGDGRLDMVVVNFLSGTVSVLLTDSQGRPPLPRAVSTASDTANVAPGSLATLSAPTGAVSSGSAYSPWPTQLGGISLEVRDSAGVSHLAPLAFLSPSQVNFQVPPDTALGDATLWVVAGGESREVGVMQVDAVAPGLFTLFPGSSVPAATAMMVEQDGTQIPLPVYRCFPTPSGTDCELSPIPLAAAGDRPVYLTFYGTGFRDANLVNVRCLFDRTPASVVYAGPQGSTQGLDQINVLVPPDLRGGSGVVLEINGVAANWVFLWVE